jgi:hypothetical protein
MPGPTRSRDANLLLVGRASRGPRKQPRLLNAGVEGDDRAARSTRASHADSDRVAIRSPISRARSVLERRGVADAQRSVAGLLHDLDMVKYVSPSRVIAQCVEASIATRQGFVGRDGVMTEETEMKGGAIGEGWRAQH